MHKYYHLVVQRRRAKYKVLVTAKDICLSIFNSILNMDLVLLCFCTEATKKVQNTQDKNKLDDNATSESILNHYYPRSCIWSTSLHMFPNVLQGAWSWKYVQIWWISYFLEIEFIHIALQIRIYVNAVRKFEEFNGNKPTQYPGQQKPRQGVIRPRRPTHSFRKQLYPRVNISEDEKESNIVKCEHCILQHVCPVYVSPNYCELQNHIEEYHKMATAHGPPVIQ